MKESWNTLEPDGELQVEWLSSASELMKRLLAQASRGAK